MVTIMFLYSHNCIMQVYLMQHSNKHLGLRVVMCTFLRLRGNELGLLF